MTSTKGGTTMSETPKKPKATKAIIAQRVEEILRIRLDGAEFIDVREYVREKEREPGSIWEVPDGAKPLSDAQLWRYIARSDQLLAQSCRASRKKLYRRHLAQRRNLYAKAVNQGDIRAALAVLDSEAKMIGLFAPVKVAPTNPQGNQSYAPLTDAERTAALQRLYAAVGTRDGGANPLEPTVADGSVLGRPGAGTDGCRDDAGPVAGEAHADDLDEGPAPLFPTGWQK